MHWRITRWTELITPRSIEDYMQKLIPARSSVLEEMELFAKENRVPIVGPLVGRVLYQLARLVVAARIFEMGSAIGYSTIWFARAVRPGGTVYYTDGSSANATKRMIMPNATACAIGLRFLPGILWI